MKMIKLLSDKELLYNRFVELCSLSIKLEDIIIGAECYSSGYENKIKFISLPYVSKYTGSLFVDCIIFCDEENYTSDISLDDRNIVNGGYNLHRVFKDEAIKDEYREIVKGYSYYGLDRLGRRELKYTIKTIPGPKLIINTSDYEER
jgi:hypothetical protein